MKPAIDSLIKQELELNPRRNNERMSPRIISLLKKSIDHDMQRSGEKIHDRLFQESTYRDRSKDLL